MRNGRAVLHGMAGGGPGGGAARSGVEPRRTPSLDGVSEVSEPSTRMTLSRGPSRGCGASALTTGAVAGSARADHAEHAGHLSWFC
jgi:hypothetical protein